MGKHIKYEFDKEAGRAKVIIFDKGKRYIGVAITHKDDVDVMSELVGLTLAEGRAEKARQIGKAKEYDAEIRKLEKRLEYLYLKRSEHIERADGIDAEITQYISDKHEFAKKLRKIRAKRGDK